MSGTELQPIKFTFQQCIEYVDVARRYSARGASSKGGVEKTSYFPAKCINISEMVRDTFVVTIND